MQFLLAAPAVLAQQTSNPMGSMQIPIMLGLVFLAFWLIVMRPEQRARQQKVEKIKAMRKGDRVITIGGLHGKVVDVDSSRGVAKIEVAPKITVKINIGAVDKVNPQEDKSAEGAQSEKDEEKDKK